MMTRAEWMTRAGTTIIAVVLFIGLPLEAEPKKLANAGAPLVSVDHWKQTLGGYDPVAYFDYGEATPGIRDFHATHNKVFYSFAGAVTHRKFVTNPEKYLPQYGGYCALSLALSEGELPERPAGLYPADPKQFKVVDDKVFLFSSELGFDAIERWNQNEDEYRARADANWKTILESRR